MTAPHLYALHDEGGEFVMADKPGWIVISEAIGSDPNDKSGRDYRHLTGRGFTVIARLNHAHNGTDGTIPMQGLYADFAKRCANFVQASAGITHAMIGNEPNHLVERPGGQVISPAMYAECFNRCYDAIKAAKPGVQVITAAIAPWDATTRTHLNPNGDWVDYFRGVLAFVKAADGLGLHTYTHGAGIHLITSSARMQPPFQHRHFEFRTYLDFLEAVPDALRGLPAYITETNQGDAWVNANTQWVQAAYAEIDAHNRRPGTQKILCLALYRWQRHDRWAIEGKQGVLDDFRAAIAKGYTSPMGDTVNVTAPPSTPTAPEPTRKWDGRLTQRGVRVDTPTNLQPGQKYWRVAKARWFNEDEAGGRHHIYVEAPEGTRFRVEWPSGESTVFANGKSGFDAGNFNMSPSLNEFRVHVDNGTPSERVVGIGMGANGNPGIHTSTLVAFELATVPAPHTTRLPSVVSEGPTPPVPVVEATPPESTATVWVTAPSGLNLRAAPESGDVLIAIPFGAPVQVTGVANVNGWLRATYEGHSGWLASAYVSTTQPEATEPAPPAPVGGNDWPRIYAYIKKWEGGFVDHPSDPGGATNKGITIGTLIRWRTSRGQPTPTVADLRALSDAEAEQIFFEWYYKASGADRLPWPLNLAQTDTAVNAGVGRAQEMLAKSNGNFQAYVGHVGIWYTTLPDFEHFGRAWARRRFELLLEASKP